MLAVALAHRYPHRVFLLSVQGLIAVNLCVVILYTRVYGCGFPLRCVVDFFWGSLFLLLLLLAFSFCWSLIQRQNLFCTHVQICYGECIHKCSQHHASFYMHSQFIWLVALNTCYCAYGIIYATLSRSEQFTPQSRGTARRGDALRLDKFNDLLTVDRKKLSQSPELSKKGSAIGLSPPPPHPPSRAVPNDD